MKMADLPGRIYSPIMGERNVALRSNNRVRDGAADMKVGEEIPITSPRMVVRLNKQHGAGTFSRKTVDGQLYLVRNK